jgi:hypothetical protein
MHLKSDRVRVAALVARATAGAANDNAVQLLATYVTAEEFADIAAPKQFIHDVYKKWEEHHTVENLFSSSSSSVQVKVPDIIIKECGAIIKEGYMVQLQHGGRGKPVETTLVHRYYTSIKDACQRSERLAQVLSDWNVTIDHLRTRLHQVCPELVQRTVEFKYQLTPERQQRRREVAAQLLLRFQDDPDFLDRVCWIDETTIWIINNKAHSQKVWADAHDEGVRGVCTTPHIAPHTGHKVHCIAVTNARLGAVACDMTTGTTDIRRRTRGMKETYMVSGRNQLYCCCSKLCVQPGSTACMYCTYLSTLASAPCCLQLT